MDLSRHVLEVVVAHPDEQEAILAVGHRWDPRASISPSNTVKSFVPEESLGHVLSELELLAGVRLDVVGRSDPFLRVGGPEPAVDEELARH